MYKTAFLQLGAIGKMDYDSMLKDEKTACMAIARQSKMVRKWADSVRKWADSEPIPHRRFAARDRVTIQFQRAQAKLDRMKAKYVEQQSRRRALFPEGRPAEPPTFEEAQRQIEEANYMAYVAEMAAQVRTRKQAAQDAARAERAALKAARDARRAVRTDQILETGATGREAVKRGWIEPHVRAMVEQINSRAHHADNSPPSA